MKGVKKSWKCSLFITHNKIVKMVKQLKPLWCHLMKKLKVIWPVKTCKGIFREPSVCRKKVWEGVGMLKKKWGLGGIKRTPPLNAVAVWHMSEMTFIWNGGTWIKRLGCGAQRLIWQHSVCSGAQASRVSCWRSNRLTVKTSVVYSPCNTPRTWSGMQWSGPHSPFSYVQ